MQSGGLFKASEGPISLDGCGDSGYTQIRNLGNFRRQL